MAITSNIVVKEYTADGVVTDFPTTYLIYLKSDVKVEVDGVLQTEGTDYIVTSLGTVNAQVEFIVPPADTTKVKLIKNNPYTQNIDLINGQKFNADNIEKALDITTMLSQQTLHELKKAPKVPSTAPEDFDGEMSSIVPLGIVRLKADSTGFESVTPAEAALSGTYTMTDGNILVGDGTSFVEEAGATARTSLGLGTISTQAASAVALTGGTIAGLSSLSVSGNITVTGLVDGVDVAGLKTDLDGFPDELKTLTASEIGELGNIGAVTISTTQWGYLGATNQGLATTDAPTFVNGDFTGTEALKVPVGTTAERPASPVDGDLRINTTVGNLEVYRDTAWRSLEAGGGTMSNLVEDTTPQLGGNLDVNGNSIVSVSAGAISITPDTTGDIILDGLKWPQADGTSGQLLTTNGAAQLSWTSAGGSGITDTMTSDINMAGFQLTSPDGTDLLDIPNGSIDLQTASTSRLDISDTGVRLGGANARVTTILDEDTMSSDSATALATQQSIKAYVDGSVGAGSGKVLQVKSFTFDDIFSTTNTTWTDTGITIDITPTATTSKIEVLCTAHGSSSSSTYYVQYRLVRDSTALAVGATAGSRTLVSGTTSYGATRPTHPMVASYLDSPSTTSATTYKLQISAPIAAGTTVYINRSPTDTDSNVYPRSASTITVREIGV